MVAIDTVFIAAVAGNDGDSWMTAASIDFRSDELNDKRVHHTSSFFCSSSFAAVDVSPFTTDYLCGSAGRRPQDHPRARSAS